MLTCQAQQEMPDIGTRTLCMSTPSMTVNDLHNNRRRWCIPSAYAAALRLMLATHILDTLCRVTPGSGAPVEAPTPSAAWELLNRQEGGSAARRGGSGGSRTMRPEAVQNSRLSGARQFGLAVPRVLGLLRGLPHAPRCARFAAWPRARPAAEPLVRCLVYPRIGDRAPRCARFAAWPRGRPAAEPLVSMCWLPC